MDALLVNVRLALAAPDAFGVNVTVNGKDWPAAIVAGNVIPDNVYSPLVLLAEETVTELPEAVRLPFNDALDPTVTVPKFNVVGETANVPAATPVPDSVMFNGELDAFDTMESVPLAAPEAVGANFAVNVTL